MAWISTLLMLLVPVGRAFAAHVETRLQIGGLAGFVFADQSRDRAGRDTSPYYDLHPIYLYTNVSLDERISAFIEVEYEHAPQITQSQAKGEIKIARGYIEVAFRDEASFRLGRFHTNFGPWSEYHWRLITPTYERIISFENQYVPAFQMGVMFFGKKAVGDQARISYSVWNSLGPEVHATNERKGRAMSNLGFELSGTRRGLTAGVAGYTEEDPSFGNRREYHGNVFGKAAKWGLTLTSELTLGKLGADKSGNAGSDLRTFHAGLEYQLNPAWVAYYRFDRGNDMKRSGRTGSASETTIHSIALKWLPRPGFTLAGEYHSLGFDASDLSGYRKAVVLAGVVF
ncbi:MAG TPA: hypothetical protein VJU18_06920 [Vicinamibacteria bacterium]|nr:hypothetical protein [Vicinamibacteria bacterium]